MPYGLSLIIKPVGLFLVGAGILQHGAHHAAPGEYERRSLHEQIRETSQSPRTDTNHYSFARISHKTFFSL